MTLTIPKQSLSLGYTTDDHCARYVQIQAFSDPYFPLGRIVFSRIWTESEILSEYEKIQIRFCPYKGKIQTKESRYFDMVFAVDNYKRLFTKNGKVVQNNAYQINVSVLISKFRKIS